MTDNADRLATIKDNYTGQGMVRRAVEDDIRWLVHQVEGLRLELASERGALRGYPRDHRELRAELRDLAEEWAAVGSGIATSPYDAGVLDTYTAVVRRIRQVLAAGATPSSRTERARHNESL